MASAKSGLMVILFLICGAVMLLSALEPTTEALKTVDIQAPASQPNNAVKLPQELSLPQEVQPVAIAPFDDYPFEVDADAAQVMRSVVIDPLYSHAESEHPETFQSVRDCFNTKGQYIAFQIEKKRRYLRVCLIDETTVGFQIVDIVGRIAKERTAYIKDGIKTLKQLFEYARYQGYPRFTGPL